MPRWKEETPEAVIKLWEWQHGATHFRAMLFQLFQKADRDNLDLLAQVYPQEMWAFMMWNGAANPEAFFERYLDGQSCWQAECEPKEPA